MLSVGTIGIPALLVAIWYVGWDLYYQLSGTGDYINFVAHLAGAAFGLGIGVVFFRNKRYWTKDLVLESVDLTRDESRLATLNGVMAGTTVAGFAFLAGLVVILVVYTFVRHFWLAMLLAAPAVAAAYQIYRSRRADRPRRETYLLGVEALERGEYDRALKLLDPLAQQNDTRALYALANLYAAGRGRPRDEAKASISAGAPPSGATPRRNIGWELSTRTGAAPRRTFRRRSSGTARRPTAEWRKPRTASVIFTNMRLGFHATWSRPSSGTTARPWRFTRKAGATTPVPPSATSKTSPPSIRRCSDS